MAAWCLATGQSPDTYRSLSVLERHAFIEVYNRNQRRG